GCCRCLFGPLAKSSGCLCAFRSAGRLVPQARGGRPQIRITAALKPEQDDGLAGVCQPRECSRERLGTPEIVGQVDNPVLETVRRLWWREFDRVCYCFVLTRVSIVDRVYRPKPPTSADLQR